MVDVYVQYLVCYNGIVYSINVGCTVYSTYIQSNVLISYNTLILSTVLITKRNNSLNNFKGVQY